MKINDFENSGVYLDFYDDMADNGIEDYFELLLREIKEYWKLSNNPTCWNFLTWFKYDISIDTEHNYIWNKEAKKYEIYEGMKDEN